MIRQDFIPDRFRVLSGSMLKLIAVVSMFIDHVGVHLVDQSIILLQFGTYKASVRHVQADAVPPYARPRAVCIPDFLFPAD